MSTAPAATPTLAPVLSALTDGARARDESGTGLAAALVALEGAGVLGFNAVAGEQRPPAAEELALVRAVAGADGSVGRVLDGHLNGVERLAVFAPAALAESELALVRDGLLRTGVWGGSPRAGEGEPAVLRRGDGDSDGAEVLTGTVTFCSGAGVLDRAAVLARDPAAAGSGPVLVWIDLSDPDTVAVDERWYVPAGLRASASHRVTFDRAPVLARLGPPGAISRQPWFGRDALRTAASWAGMADAAATAALLELSARRARGDIEALAAGRIAAARSECDVWLAAAARAMDSADSDLGELALHARVAIAGAARTILDEAARACGSHPFATGGDLDRSRRDLELFLLQHRLEPMLARSGQRRLDGLAPGPPR